MIRGPMRIVTAEQSTRGIGYTPDECLMNLAAAVTRQAAIDWKKGKAHEALSAATWLTGPGLNYLELIGMELDPGQALTSLLASDANRSGVADRLRTALGNLAPADRPGYIAAVLDRLPVWAESCKPKERRRENKIRQEW